MECKASMPTSQLLATCPCSWPDKSVCCIPPYICKIHFNIFHLFVSGSSKLSLFHIFQLEPCMPAHSLLNPFPLISSPLTSKCHHHVSLCKLKFSFKVTVPFVIFHCLISSVIYLKVLQDSIQWIFLR